MPASAIGLFGDSPAPETPLKSQRCFEDAAFTRDLAQYFVWRVGDILTEDDDPWVSRHLSGKRQANSLQDGELSAGDRVVSLAFPGDGRLDRIHRELHLVRWWREEMLPDAAGIGLRSSERLLHRGFNLSEDLGVKILRRLRRQPTVVDELLFKPRNRVLA